MFANAQIQVWFDGNLILGKVFTIEFIKLGDIIDCFIGVCNVIVSFT